MIHVESEETQDNLRESLATSQEEAGEIGFVPSASGEPRGVCSWCDNRCSEKGLMFLQIASMVIEEDGDARTINLCQRCYNEKLVQQGKQSLKSKDWREVVERQAHRGRLWKIFGSEQFLRGMWEYFNLKRAWARKILAASAHEKTRRNYKVSGNKSLPSKKFWSKSKARVDTDMQCPSNWESASKRNAGKKGSIERLQEAYDKVALEDIGRLSICTGPFCEITRTS